MEARVTYPEWGTGGQGHGFAEGALTDRVHATADIIRPHPAQGADALQDVIRRDLSVSVDSHDNFATRVTERGVQTCGHNLAWIVDETQVRVPSLVRLNDLARAVGRAAVSHQDLESFDWILLGEHCSEAAGDEASFLPDGHDDGDKGQIARAHRRKRCARRQPTLVSHTASFRSPAQRLGNSRPNGGNFFITASARTVFPKGVR